MNAHHLPSPSLTFARRSRRRTWAIGVAGILLAAGSTGMAGAQQAAPASADTGSIESDGTVVVPSFRLPPSIYLSEAARKAMPRTPTDQEAMMIQAIKAGKAGEMRSKMPQYMAPQIKRLAANFPVTMRNGQIAGVEAVTVTPAQPMPKANRRKILLNLPGGGFVMGKAGGTGMLESIPLAAKAQVEIVSITYRQAPEAVFPAASEDVAAVYRELLKTHKPQDIGIFGCSAGGLLTAESMAWFLKEKLPLPGAIGIFCASADGRWGGDSQAWGRPFQALPPRAVGLSYFDGADMSSPLVSPALSPETLTHFPPTLLITGTRSFDMSAAVNTHRELVKAGVDAELHLWDGHGHAFFFNSDLPEAREAFDVMANFFRKHLGLKQ